MRASSERNRPCENDRYRQKIHRRCPGNVPYDLRTGAGARTPTIVDVTQGQALKLLERAEFFGQLSQIARQRMVRLASRRTCRAGETLYLCDDAGDAVYVVERGAVELSVVGSTGRKLVLNIIGSGAMFGEVAALDGGSRTVSAVAVAPTRLLHIARHHILDLLANEPSVAVELIRILCRRYRFASSQLEDRALLPVPARTAKRLLAMASANDDISDPIDISQNTLADMVGATRESINRVLVGWREAGWIELSRRQIRLCRVDEIRRLASDPTVAPRR